MSVELSVVPDDGLVVPWVACTCCDDYICQVCSPSTGTLTHVADCDCPPIDHWADHGLYPYGPCCRVDVQTMIYLCLEDELGDFSA